MKTNVSELKDEELLEIYKLISNYIQELEKKSNANDWWDKERDRGI